METDSKPKKSMSFFDIIKNLLILLVFLQFAPIVIGNIKTYIQDITSPKSHVGCISIKGVIGSSSFYAQSIEKFLKDPDIKALIIKMDSPGGLPGSSQAIFSEINRFKKEKPVVVFVENICTSGGYYIACASNNIISTPSALVGGIGVLLQLPNVKGFLDSWKIHFQYIQSGKYKTAGSPLKDHSQDELLYLQNLSDKHYDQFINDVALSRKLDSKEHKTWADGKVFVGTEALELKLVDKIGSYQEAIDEIKKLANIETEIKFISAKPATSISRFFYGDEEEESDGTSFSSCIANFIEEVYTKVVTEKQVGIKSL